jgi:hypothetical protein
MRNFQINSFLLRNLNAMKTNIQLMLIVMLSLCSFQLSAQGIIQSQWQKHEGEGKIVLKTNFLGDPAAYSKAKIPALKDTKWETLPNGININQQNSTVKGLEEVNFTYFQTIVDIPASTKINTFTVTFGQIDDGARAYIFNSKYPNGTFHEGAEFILRKTTTAIADFHEKVVAGEANRIVIVQFDNQMVGNTIKQVDLIINGKKQTVSTKTVAEIPLITTLPEMVGHWTFEPGNERNDLVNNFETLTLVGGATISNGKLNVSQAKWAVTNMVTSKVVKEKTLVAWVIIDDVNARGGSAITYETSNRDFDAIVYAERTPKEWMSGSGGFSRTDNPNGGNNYTTAQGKLVKVAITYTKNNAITIYVDGKKVHSYTRGKMIAPNSATNNTASVLFGMRHTPMTMGIPGGGAWFVGKIEEARIYGGVLNESQISGLKVEK